MKGVLQMKISTMALFFGGALVLSGAGLGLAACSSDSGTGTPTGGGDSGSNTDGTSHTDGAMQGDTAPQGDSATGDDGGDGGAGCKHGNPPNVHPSDGGPTALFCGFKANDGGTLACDPHTQLCCVGGKQGTGFADPVCIAAGGTCMNGMNPKPIACEDQNDCPTAGNLCCYTGAVPQNDPACGYYYASSNIATNCATTCAAGQSRICTSDSQCATGQTCTPFKSIYFGLGFCK